MKTIYVQKGKEYSANIECIYRKEIFFEDIYRRARDCTEEILQINERLADANGGFEGNPCGADPSSACADGGYGYVERMVNTRFSNVIAFCAERGQGKTSAMLSHAKALEKISYRLDGELDHQKRAFWEHRKAGCARYEVLNSIDPTGMEPDDSILKIVLSQMFSHFQEAYDHRGGRNAGGDDWERAAYRLQNKFLECFHLANLLNAEGRRNPPTNMEDELEVIAETGGGVNLRTKLYRLIEDYLHFVEPAWNGAKYLVVPIDDADLNVGRVYDLLENIRKYLQLPRVIVLLATNIIQLESTVEQHFLKEYQWSLSFKHTMVDVGRCHQISERYLEKILPGARRLYLPNLDEEIKVHSAGLRVVYLDTRAPGNEKDLLGDEHSAQKAGEADGDPVPEKQWGYQEQLLYYLHRKTGILFLPPDQGLHAFLPGSMRELAYFLLHFGAMEDVPADYRTVKNYVFDIKDGTAGREEVAGWLRLWRENLKKLKEYLLENWSASNLSTEGRKILLMLNGGSGRWIHQSLLQRLPAYYGQKRAEDGGNTENVSAYHQQFLNECARFGAYSPSGPEEKSPEYPNNCYADVLTALRVLGNFSRGEQERKLVYAIRLYYSIEMHMMLLERMDRPLGEEQKYYLTDFLGGAPFKEGSYRDGTAPFTLCSFPVSKEWVLGTVSGPGQQMQAVLNTWFRHLVQEDHAVSARHLVFPGKKRKEDWEFHPLHFLLAELDALTSRQVCGQNPADYLKQQYAPGSSAEWRMVFSLAGVLHGTFQSGSRHLVKCSAGASDQPAATLVGRIREPYGSTPVRCLWSDLEKVNQVSFQPQGEEGDWIKELFGGMEEQFGTLLYGKAFYPAGMEMIEDAQETVREAQKKCESDIKIGEDAADQLLKALLNLCRQFEILKENAARELSAETAKSLEEEIKGKILDPVNQLTEAGEEAPQDKAGKGKAKKSAAHRLYRQYWLGTTPDGKGKNEELRRKVEKILQDASEQAARYYMDREA